MTFREADDFLSNTEIDNTQPSRWADLGCGSGLFTKVLSGRLANGSTIYAIDKAVQSTFLSTNEEVKIVTQQADFVKDDLLFPGLNGILMANTLHYVQDKKAFLQKLRPYLLQEIVFIIVEYDNAKANPWVPYPISFSEIKELFGEAGYRHIEKTGERKSVYQSGMMYVCSIKP